MKKKTEVSSLLRKTTNRKKYGLENICDGSNADRRDETWFHDQSMIDDIVHKRYSCFVLMVKDR